MSQPIKGVPIPALLEEWISRFLSLLALHGRPAWIPKAMINGISKRLLESMNGTLADETHFAAIDEIHNVKQCLKI